MLAFALLSDRQFANGRVLQLNDERCCGTFVSAHHPGVPALLADFP